MIDKEFKILINKPSVKDALTSFDRKTERLDHFWRNIWMGNNSSEVLISFLKKVFLISHGNAFVERGFSINKEFIVENQKPKSLVALRRVYDAIQMARGVENVEITKQMMLKFRNARNQYSDALKKQKEEEKEKGKENLRKRQISDKMQELKEKKRKIQLEKQKELEDVEEEIHELIKAR